MAIKTAAPSAELRELFARKLKSSGIDTKLADKYKLQLYTAEEAAKQLPGLPLYTGGIKITYFDINGKPIPGYRYRHLQGEQHSKGSFSAVTNGNGSGPAMRYTQPKGSNPIVYFPPSMPWSKVAENTQVPIFITEGEFKAITASLHQLSCIGLGGVQMFSDRKNGEFLLKELTKIDWKNRMVYIVFDSDSVTNPNVRAAEYRLANEMVNQGATPMFVRLPNVLGPNDKTGLDDFLVAKGRAEFDNLVRLADPYKQAYELYRMAQEVVYINEADVMYRLPTGPQPKGFSMRTDKFVSSHYAHWRYIEKVGEKNVERSTAAEFVKWPMRPQYERFTFAPGQPRQLGDSFNTWSGWPYTPAKGSVALWHQFMEWVFKGSPHRKWFEQWVAYPMQHPGTKLKQAVLVWGEEGTGKTFCGQLIAQLYGPHANSFGNHELMSPYNSYAENVQFAVCNEISAKNEERRQISETLKTLITEPTITIHHKYLKPYPMPNCMNIMFTSNHAVPVRLGANDRRYFIHQIEGGRMPADLAKALDGAQHTKEFNSALFYYFMNLDLSGFEPMAEPPMTEEKASMVAGSLTDYEDWLLRLRNEPEIVLTKRVQGHPAYRYDLATSDDIYNLYVEDNGSANSRQVIGKQTIRNALRQLRFTKAYNGAVRTIHGSRNLWVLRNHSKYLNKTPKQIGDMYNAERELKFAKKAGQ